MLREPGPIPPLDTSGYPTTYDTPDFTDLVNTTLAAVDQAFGSMDALFDPTAIFDDALSGDTIMADLDTVDQLNGSNAHLANLAPISNIDGFKADGDAALTAAIQKIPGEAFQDVPDATQYGSVAPTAPTAAFSSITITNLTHPGHAAFLAGDQFQIVVQMDTTTGNVNDYFQVHIYAEMTKDGVTQTNLEFNDTDHTGSTTDTAQWTQSDVGNWQMTVHAVPFGGANIVSSPVSWSVATSTAPALGPTVPAVTVQLKNWTSGDLGNSHSGDTWQLFITGPPNQPVYIWPTHNGTALNEATLGTTDATGNYTIADKWSDTDIGQWVEIYGVGRFLMQGNISFTIKPAGAL